MREKEVTVKLKSGLQARSAAQFVQEASQYSADVFLEKDGRKVNAKSIMGLMSLAIGPNSSITILTAGDDEEEAINALAAFVESEG